LTCVVPATYYIEILNGIYLKNLTLAQMWPNYLVLIGMFLFLGVLNVIFMKKEGL
jgi:ABC-2 type transport system permease protein